MNELQFFFLNHHVSAREFARTTGLHYATLIKVKNGTMKPSEDFLRRLKEGMDLYE